MSFSFRSIVHCLLVVSLGIRAFGADSPLVSGPSAASTRLVDVSGHVVSCVEEWRMLFLWSSGGMISVKLGENTTSVPSGTPVLVRGRQETGKPSELSEASVLLEGKLPEGMVDQTRPADELSLREMLSSNGGLISVEGVVWAFDILESHIRILLVGEDGFSAVLVKGMGLAKVQKLLFRRLTCSGLALPSGIQRIGDTDLLVPSVEYLDAERVVSTGEEEGGLLGRLDSSFRGQSPLNRVVGTIEAQLADGCFRLRLNNGTSVSVAPIEARIVSAGDHVALLGSSFEQEGEAWLSHARFLPGGWDERRPQIRKVGSFLSAGTIERAIDVRLLSNAEAASGRPVQLNGVVSYFDHDRWFWFVEDGTGGVYVHRLAVEVSCQPGDSVVVHGRTSDGTIIPIVHCVQWEYGGTGNLRSPIPVSCSWLETGVYDSQRTVVRGIVQGIDRIGEHYRIHLARERCKIAVWVPRSVIDQVGDLP